MGSAAGLLGGEDGAFVLRDGGGAELVYPRRERDVHGGDFGFGAEVYREGLVDGAGHEDGVAGGGEGETEELADGADAVGEEEVVRLDGDVRVEALVHVVGHGAAQARGPPWSLAVGELVRGECDRVGLGVLGDFGDHDVVFCRADVWEEGGFAFSAMMIKVGVACFGMWRSYVLIMPLGLVSLSYLSPRIPPKSSRRLGPSANSAPRGAKVLIFKDYYKRELQTLIFSYNCMG